MTDTELIPEKLTRPRKARRRRMSPWREGKTMRHVTVGGVGIVGKLRRKKHKEPSP